MNLQTFYDSETSPAGAAISDCKNYRYLLWRVWSPLRRRLAFIMLNPSTAGKYSDDSTIKRCCQFAARDGYGGILVANLFAYRCTDPSELPGKGSAIGPENDDVLQMLAEGSKTAGLDVVFAWGTNGTLDERNKKVISMFPKAFCLELTKDGHPKHPLYIKGDAELKPFIIPAL